jgi:hypothetical protein
MAKSLDVISMLIPNGGWVLIGDEFEGIQFLDCEPITKAEFEAGFAKFDLWKAEQEAIKSNLKADLLQRLGITADEIALLLS